MKRIFTFCIFTILVGNAHAQELSLGLRTGTACWTEGKDGKGYKVQSLHVQSHTWDNEFFARFITKHKWAFEMSLTYTHFKGSPEVMQVFDAPSGWSEYTKRISVNSYALTISAQYDVTYSHIQCCPLMKSVRSYIGINITPVWSNVLNRSESTDLTHLNEQSQSRDFEIWAGISHTIFYPLGKHLSLTSVFDFKFAPDRFFSDAYKVSDFGPTTKTGIRIGAAYKL